VGCGAGGFKGGRRGECEGAVIWCSGSMMAGFGHRTGRRFTANPLTRPFVLPASVHPPCTYHILPNPHHPNPHPNPPTSNLEPQPLQPPQTPQVLQGPLRAADRQPAVRWRLQEPAWHAEPGDGAEEAVLPPGVCVCVCVCVCACACACVCVRARARVCVCFASGCEWERLFAKVQLPFTPPTALSSPTPSSPLINPTPTPPLINQTSRPDPPVPL